MRYSIYLNSKVVTRSRVTEKPKMLSMRDFLDALVFDALEHQELELTLPFNLVVVIDGCAYRFCPTEEGSNWVQMLAATS